MISNTLVTELQTLIQRLQSISEHHAALSNCKPSLIVADALSDLQHTSMGLETAPMLVVIGPTQSGKSTLTNCLLGVDVAKPSPLAGFTQHLQAFSETGFQTEVHAFCESFLPSLTLLELSQLQREHPEAIAITEVKSSATKAVVWDTPDFDSTSAVNYTHNTLRLCAAADLIILTVSREKYADQKVWDMLALLEPLKKPLIICLNKVDPQNQAVLIDELQRLADKKSISLEQIIALPYSSNGQDELMNSDAIANLQARANQYQEHTPPSTDTLIHFATQHWQEWTTPIRQENDAITEWNDLINDQVERAATEYEDNYLNNAHYDETMQKAMMRLLELLEIPHVAPVLNKTRQIITWPARQLLKQVGKATGKKKNPNQELLILSQILDNSWTSLEKKALSQAADDHVPWWKSLSRLINDDDIQTQHWTGRIERYQQNFEPEIESAARALYEHLQQHPKTLNSLRAARVSADAAGIILAVKSAGLSVSDLFLAPAMLSFTSLITESAVGTYMQGVTRKLKQQQLALVKSELLTDSIATPLQQHALSASRENFNISDESLDTLQKVMDEVST